MRVREREATNKKKSYGEKEGKIEGGERNGGRERIRDYT